MKRGIIVAGGTGGHIYPGIAIGKEIKRLYPEIELLFIGRNREMEKSIYEREGLLFKGIDIQSRGFKFFLGFLESLIILAFYKPDFVLGLGSYISFPMIFWAKLFGIPTFLQEQNVMPGVATRFLERWVEKIFLGYGRSSYYLKNKDKIKLTGNPIRFKRKDKTEKKAREILVFGGSLGAKKISQTVIGVTEFIKANNIPFNYRFVLITGREDYETFLPFQDKELLILYPYVYDIERLYKRAVLVISRAGALTISEIAYFGLPSILIPYPLSKKNHQLVNASLLVEKGIGVLVEDEKLTVDLLWKEIYNILGNRKKLKSLHYKSLKFLFNKSCEKIARFMVKFY